MPRSAPKRRRFDFADSTRWGSPARAPGERKIVSWNLLRRTGAAVECLVELIERETPDLVLMQEATEEIAALPEKVGGVFARAPLPGRIHGPAMWSPTPWLHPPEIVALPSGVLIDRVCQVLDLGAFGVANVHLSHGQMLNRRQLRRIQQHLPERAAVLGDYNIVGPALLPGFRDVGPRRPTHAMADMVPLRLDRCLVRGLVCHERAVLARGLSDHRPIVVSLAPGTEAQARFARLRGMAEAVGRLRRAGAPGARERPDRPLSAGSRASPG
ncbi:endonuclease/exonuclease/phosphatase family protein [Methylobacterium organophilum]|uniref:endonuclease/exonuclease/phosphatase family protein n=1 Tax=Methylobacterium organophilum TaxID=410 RepID=UPI001F12DB4C|nr:endonuclease/exonuclease/phosphatase family protein [Methylobacterium organophilum]UMY15747.1 endonuclease/exonuclease/phosphatase family protein [Methylobacterium organophilum]